MKSSQLMKARVEAFVAEASETADVARRLEHIIQNFTSIDCPLNPCGTCPLIECLLREPRRTH